MGALGKQVQFWTPFSEKMSRNPAGLHGLGAARKLKADPPDPPDPANLPEWCTAGTSDPRFSAPEARMTVVKLTPSNKAINDTHHMHP